MWGLKEQNLDELVYQGKKVQRTLSKPGLWARSDLCRLESLLQLPTFDKINLEKY